MNGCPYLVDGPIRGQLRELHRWQSIPQRPRRMSESGSGPLPNSRRWQRGSAL